MQRLASRGARDAVKAAAGALAPGAERGGAGQAGAAARGQEGHADGDGGELGAREGDTAGAGGESVPHLDSGPWTDVRRWLEAGQRRQGAEARAPREAGAAKAAVSGSEEPDDEDEVDIELRLFGYALRQPSKRGCVCRPIGCQSAPSLFGGGSFCLIEPGCEQPGGSLGGRHQLDDDTDVGDFEGAEGWPARSAKALQRRIGEAASTVFDACEQDADRRPARRPPGGRWRFDDTDAEEEQPEARS